MMLRWKDKNRFTRFLWANKWALLLVLLLLAQRLYALDQLNATYNLHSDDYGYIKSGKYFAATGSITMHNSQPSAQIMPGMPVLIGTLSRITPNETMLYLALKLMWVCMGALTPFVIYKTVTLFTPKWCGILPMLFFFMPDFVWMDNVILTETPFLCLLCVMVYATFQMGRTQRKKYFWMCFAAYFCAVMLKANIAVYPLFALAYLFLAKYDRKMLLRQSAVLAGLMLCFLIPWTIRNYIQFEAFIPLTYGSGNPMLEGTYQGEGYPADEALDYDTNVEKVFQEKYAKYYDEEGRVREPRFTRYLALEKDSIKANYRMKVWWESNPRQFLKSYLKWKPENMIFSVFYWKPLFDVQIDSLLCLREKEWYVTLFLLLLCFIRKKNCLQAGFLFALYIINIYIYSMTYSFSRYAATLLPLRFMILGIGSYVLWDSLKWLFFSVKIRLAKA